ncbi:MAG TPA: hypothetical protein V6C84_21945 [Coleofasciculaceae cyanobacterium]|jgi:hypothetical protein
MIQDIKDTGTLKLAPQKTASYGQNQSAVRLASTDALTQPIFRVQRRASADGAGNTKTTATSLGTFPGKRTVRDSVSRGDSDFYSFTLDVVSNVKVSFLNRSQNPIYKAVLKEDGSFYLSRRKAQAGIVEPRDETLSPYRRLRPGTYYIKLQGRTAASSNYTLSVNITNSPAEVDCGCGD